MYIYIYMHTYTRTHIYIYIYVHMFVYNDIHAGNGRAGRRARQTCVDNTKRLK